MATTMQTPVRRVQQQPLPEIGWLEVAALGIDSHYQHRPYGRAVQTLAENFVPEFSGFILVNIREDGTAWIIDGQTRCAVHEELHMRWIRAEILRGLTRKGEADVYLLKAKNIQRTPIDWFRAEYTSGKPEAVLIHDIVAKHGLQVQQFAEPEVPQSPKVVVTCVHALKQLLKVDPQGTCLDEALELIIATWGYDKAGFSGRFIRVMHTIMMRHSGEITHQRFITKLGGHMISELWGMAKQLRFAHTPNLQEGKALFQKIVEIYNSNLQGQRRIAL